MESARILLFRGKWCQHNNYLLTRTVTYNNYLNAVHTLFLNVYNTLHAVIIYILTERLSSVAKKYATGSCMRHVCM